MGQKPIAKRTYCPRCGYPQSTCICHAISLVQSDMAISIIQDPVESTHAKNTVRLASLILPQVEVFVGQTPQDFEGIRDKLNQFETNLLIYPTESAANIQQLGDAKRQYQHLILLDGSWRKAKKLWLCNPWLHHLDAGYLAIESKTKYAIRKSSTENSLSSLEALGHTLNILEGISLNPFHDALAAMQGHWTQYQKS